MRRARLALGAVAAVGLGTGSATAQVTADSMVSGRPSRTVDLSASAGVRYHDNIAHQNKSTPSLQGLEPRETIYSPTATANIVFPVGQQALFLRGSASYQFYDKNTRLDHSQFDVQGGGAGKVGPCGLSVGGGYLRGLSQIDNAQLVARVDNISSVTSVQAGVTCVRPPGIGVVVSGGKSWGYNSLAEFERSDYESETISGGVIIGRPAKSSVSLQGNYARTEYPNRLSPSGGMDGFETYGAGVQVERSFGARIQGKASVSYTQGKQLQPIAPVPGGPDPKTEFNGITYSGSISYRASSRLKGELRFERQLTPTLVVGKSYEVQTNFAVQLDYRIGNRMIAGLGGSQKDNASQGGLTNDPNELVKSRSRNLVGTLRYRQNDRLSFVLSGQIDRRTTNNPMFDYTDKSVGLLADVNF